MSSPLLSLRGIGRQYSGAAAGAALDGVDLDVGAGEFVAVVGRSGAGKSTLLNVLGLLDSADAGEYRIDGVDVAGLGEAERDALRARTFGFVFQDSFVVPRESVARNAALPLRMRGETREAQVEAVSRVLDEFGLLALAEQPAGTLSGGERQRTALARAVVGRPSVVLADEPTGNLDAATTGIVLDSLLELHRSGVTVVLITHSAEVAAVADRRVRLAGGRLESDSGSSDPARADSTVDDRRPDRQADRPHRTQRPSRWLVGDAVSALLLSPARTLGILAAFVIAVAGLVTSVGMSATAAEQITQRLDAAALDQVTVRMPADSTPERLRSAADTVASLDGVLAASARTSLPAAAARPARWVGGSSIATDAPVLAVDRAFLDTVLLSVAPAAAVDWIDVEDGVPVALLGEGAAAALGIPPMRTGDTIGIAGQNVVVAGFVTAAPRDPALAESILVSSTDFVVPEQSDRHVVVRTIPGRPAAIAESIPLAIDPGRPETVVVQTVADLRLLTRGVGSDLAANLAVVSAVLLLLVCFSSATSMYLTVSSRTREIALRRAVGATRSDIRRLFLLEGAAVGVAGGVSGLALGTLATALLSGLQGWEPVFDPTSAAIGVSAGAVAGALSAVGPAFRAARVEPALALRAG